MPLFKTSLRLATDQPGIPARKWSNTFYLETNSVIDAANRVRDGWIQYLRGAARQRVYAYEVYATDLNAATETFAVLPIAPGSQRGIIIDPAGGLQPYLPKACAAVTLSVLGSRPSRKFWRPGFLEDDIIDGVQIQPALVTLITNQFAQFIDGLFGALVDPDVQEIAGVSKIRLTTREFGREATADVPAPPALG